MIPKRLYYLLVGCLCLVVACVDPFEITFEDGPTEFLVVDGSLSLERRPHQLKMYYTNSQITRRRKPIEGARVALVMENGSRINYKDLGTGNYELLAAQIQGQAGDIYFVEIDLPNGQQYRSRPAPMPRKIEGGNAYIKFGLVEEALITGAVAKRASLEVFVDSPLPLDGEDYWLKWEVSTLYSFPEVLCGPVPTSPLTCFIPGINDAQDVVLLNGKSIRDSRIQGLKVNEKRLIPSDAEFRGRFYFLVNQQSVTHNAYDYWQKVNRVANQTGSIFDAPPAGIPSNIYNVNNEEEVVLGFFELQSTDSLRAFITAADFADNYQFTTIVCPNPRVAFDNPRNECCNCQLIENASLIRPEWF